MLKTLRAEKITDVSHFRLPKGRNWLLAVVAINAAIGLLFLIWLNWSGYGLAIKKIEDSAASAAHLAEQQINWVVAGSRLVLSQAADSLVPDGPEAALSTANARHHLQMLSHSLPKGGALWVFNTQGTPVFSSTPDPLEHGAFIISPKAIARHRTGTVFSINEAMLETSGQRAIFTVSHTIFADNRFYGVVLAAYDAALLHDLAEEIDFPDSAVLEVFTSDGWRLARTPFDPSLFHPGETQPLNMGQSLRSQTAANQKEQALEFLASGENTAEWIRHIQTGQSAPIIVAASIPTADGLSEWRWRMTRNVLIWSAVLLIVMPLTFLGMHLLQKEEQAKARLQNQSRELHEAKLAAEDLAKLFSYSLDAAGVVAWRWQPADGQGWQSEGLSTTHHDVRDLSSFSGVALHYLCHEEDRPKVMAVLQEALRKGDDFEVTYRIRNKRGEQRWILDRGRVIKRLYGEKQVLGISIDVTEQEKLLQQKDLLLREVNHRVMNNLQVIASFLDMQARKATDQNERRRIEQIHVRITALATVYRRLYHGDSADMVEVGSYLEGLCADLSRTLVDAQKVSVILHIRGRAEYPVDDLINLGLVVAELLTNALKYAFIDRRNGQVTLTFEPQEQTMMIEIADNGVGLPVDFKAGLGISLINAIIRQLRGRWEIGEGPGAVFRIFVPIDRRNAPQVQAIAPVRRSSNAQKLSA